MVILTCEIARLPDNVARPSAKLVQDVGSLIEKFSAGFDEILCRTLKPGGGHPAIRMPDSRKAFPIACITIQNPILHCLTDGKFICK